MPRKDKKYEIVVRIAALLVAINALVIIISTLIDEKIIYHGFRPSNISISINLLAGLFLLYFSRLLSRRKRVAWIVVIGIYLIFLLHNMSLIGRESFRYGLTPYIYLRDFLTPALIVVGLSLSRSLFIVKSDIKSFASSFRFILMILLITFGYGVLGFMIMDTRDFHHEINFLNAAQNTIDQFGLTGNSLVPYTARARLFLDSLSLISILAIVLSITSLFKPVKSRLIDQFKNRLIMHELLLNYPACSEDFFKIWPHDKDYFINTQQNAGLAYQAHSSHALIVGDPAGEQREFPELLKSFDELCYVNDWSPVFVHVEDNNRLLYESMGYTMQKLGEEAIVDLNHFSSHVINNKYFRNIRNKFDSANYTNELLLAPHSPDILNALHKISNEWLKSPGRTERGLIMGYYTTSYMQQCNILVAKNSEGTIMGFINQVPSYDKKEANYDLLRSSKQSLGNINDYLMLNFINECINQGYQKVNLGLCPLSGLDGGPNEDNKLLDKLLSFTYTNGDKLYSFSGLRKFKNKYEPEWSPRYLCYRGGIINFTKSMNSLNKSWKVHFRNIH